VGKPEGFNSVAPLLDLPDSFEWFKVDIEAATCIDFRNKEDISHGGRSSNTMAVATYEALDGPQAERRPMSDPAVNRNLMQG
jgi:hypothetical protein